MATVTKSIGTTGRNYSTITAWEADLDNTGIYASGDVAVGECYDDAAFNESVIVNGGGTIGLASVKVSVASGHRHDGTAGTGARIVRTASSSGAGLFVLVGATKTAEWLEINANGTQWRELAEAQGANVATGPTYNRCILHGTSNPNNAARGFSNVDGSSILALNSIVYDITSSYGLGAVDASGVYLHPSNYNVRLLNLTIFKITNNGSTGTAYGVGDGDGSARHIRNVIAVDPGGSSSGTKQSFGTATYASATVSNNIASDTSASGTGSLDSQSSSSLFVSTTAGSEDLHLKANSPAIRAGVDLVQTPAGVHIDIDGYDRDAGGKSWSIGADEWVRTTTKSIGTTGRDYSTITAWEADLDSTSVYSKGDDAVGECYDDSVFSEAVTIDGGSTIVLDGVTLRAAAGHRHDGATGGVEAQGGFTCNGHSSFAYNIEWLHLSGTNPVVYGGTAGLVYIRNLIAHGYRTNSAGSHIAVLRGNSGGSTASTVGFRVMNCAVWDAAQTGGGSRAMRGIFLANGSRYGQAYNCTVYNITGNGTGGSFGCQGDSSNSIATNCIAAGITNTAGGVAECFDSGGAQPLGGTNNLSDDATAHGTGSLTNKTAANQFVSTTVGSEDLHLKAGADAIDAGFDLGTTPTGVNLDINGLDRATATVLQKGLRWDIGAHEFQDPWTHYAWEHTTPRTLTGNVITENFDDNALDTDKWTEVGAATVTITETNQRLEITTANNVSGDNYRYIETAAFDFTGKEMIVRVPQVAAGVSRNTIFRVGIDTNRQYDIYHENGTLFFRRIATGFSDSVSSIAYSATTHLWWRIRESGGTVYFDTSPNKFFWTNQASDSAGYFSLAAVKVSLGAGSWAAVPSATAHFDDFIMGNAEVIDSAAEEFAEAIWYYSSRTLTTAAAVKAFLHNLSMRTRFFVSRRLF